MTRPSWLCRAVRNQHHHAIEQASRRWRRGRRDDSARTRRKILISTQVRKWYPDLADLVSLSIVEAGPNLLAGFDETCWQYYTKHLREHNVDVRTGCAITAVDPADDGRVLCGNQPVRRVHPTILH